MQNDGLRGDRDILRIHRVVLVDVFESELHAFFVEGNGLVNDAEIMRILRGGRDDERHRHGCASECERKQKRSGGSSLDWRRCEFGHCEESGPETTRRYPERRGGNCQSGGSGCGATAKRKEIKADKRSGGFAAAP